MNVPCNGCTDRHAGCHGSCEKYAAFKAEMEKVNEQRQAFQKGWFDYKGYQKQKFKRLTGNKEEI